MLQRPKIRADALSSAFSWEARVDSWLGGTWLGRVPVKAGSVTWTTSQQVPEPDSAQDRRRRPG